MNTLTEHELSNQEFQEMQRKNRPVTSSNKTWRLKKQYLVVYFGSGISTTIVLAVMLAENSALILMITSAYTITEHHSQGLAKDHILENNKAITRNKPRHPQLQHNKIYLRHVCLFSKYSINKDKSHLKGSCFFNQRINTKRRLEFLGHSVVHNRKFTVWWNLTQKVELNKFLHNSIEIDYLFNLYTIIKATSSWFHSPGTKSCPHQNYQDVQIHESYNHQVPQLLTQLNFCNLSQKEEPDEICKRLFSFVGEGRAG